MPWPTPMHMVRERVAAAGALQLLGRGERQAGARHAERMAERDRAAVGVHVRRRRRRVPSWRSTARPWAAKASLSSITSMSAMLEAEALRAASRVAGAGPMPMIRGGTPATARAEDPGARRQAVALRRFLGGDDQRGGAVVDARGIAGGDGAVVADDRLQLGRAPRRWSARGCSSRVDDDRVALALRDRDRRRSRRRAGRSPARRRPSPGCAARRRPGPRG